MSSTSYFRLPNLGPDCSTQRSAQLRELRFNMGYEARQEPAEYTTLATQARDIYLAHEAEGPATARAQALRHVVENCPVTPTPNALFIGGEDPFFFNLMLPALQADRHSREEHDNLDPDAMHLRDASVFMAACFEGHITPGLEFILGQGLTWLQARVEEELWRLQETDDLDLDRVDFYNALLWSCDSVRIYTQRYREAALQQAEKTEDDNWAMDLRQAARWLENVPEQPAKTFAEALQSYWIAYVLVTLEMGGCCPGGGLGLGRLDQFLLPYYRNDIETGHLTRDEALELMELFLLNFRHVDYYTGHQVYTPGSHGSLGGQTPLGEDAFNELTELILEASLRIAMPAPYLSLRLHKNASDYAWEIYANYIAGGLGFPIVNDEVLIPAFLRHGRSLFDARDYICSCCYENTIPGREAFNPNGSYLNLPLILELALNEGRLLLTGEKLGVDTIPLEQMADFTDLLAAFEAQLNYVAQKLVEFVNTVDERHAAYRRYPLMSLLIDDCISRGKDVCSGGARYNLTGLIVSGLPNTVNSLAAISKVIFENQQVAASDLLDAMQMNFKGFENLQKTLLATPKWGNGDDHVDSLATIVTDCLYQQFGQRPNARGGRWQVALYSFVANHHLGQFVGASADGRMARESLTRNLNPTWGTDRQGPTGVLRSLSHIDFTQFPNGASLDLRFDPAIFETDEGRQLLVAFLKSFVDLGIMQMQISMVDTQTLLDAQENPAKYPNLMVKVAGYSARFIDLDPQEQAEIIGRTAQQL